VWSSNGAIPIGAIVPVHGWLGAPLGGCVSGVVGASPGVGVLLSALLFLLS